MRAPQLAQVRCGDRCVIAPRQGGQPRLSILATIVKAVLPDWRTASLGQIRRGRRAQSSIVTLLNWCLHSCGYPQYSSLSLDMSVAAPPTIKKACGIYFTRSQGLGCG